MTSQSIHTPVSEIPSPDLVYKQNFLRFFAWLISFVFHPLFIPLFVSYFILFLHPGYFIGFNNEQRWMVFLRIAINMVAFPLFSVVLLKAVGFIDSVFLKTQRDRIIPYIGCGIFFFWMYLVFRNQSEIPVILTSFIFGVFLASSAALIANIYYKISMHAIGCGGLLGVLFMILSDSPTSSLIIPLMIGFLMTGLVCTARMIMGHHSPKEIYMGLFVGIIFQIIAATFIL